MTRHTLQLPDDLYALLTNMASEVGQTPDEMILAAIKERLEDLEDMRAAENVLEARANGESKTYSLAEVSRQLGLGD